MTVDQLPWVEKYRPKSLAEVIDQGDFIDENRLPHLLFYGPPGTGKTSLVLAIARKIYGESFRSNVLELNASDERGIDVVRDQIKSFASRYFVAYVSKNIFQQSSSGFKLIVLDEADAMTQTAQNALRRVIEKYTRNVRFVIICNYVGKIIPPIQSRCTRFRFAPLKPDTIRARLSHVAENEGLSVTDAGVDALLKLGKGDMRRVLNIMQACASHQTITDSLVYQCVGSPMNEEITQILDWLMNSDFSSAFNSILKMTLEKGYALVDILSEILPAINGLELPSNVRITLVENMSEIEYNLQKGCADKIQLGALVAAFKIAMTLAEK